MSMVKSEQLYQRAIKVIPGATQTLSKGADRFVMGVHPKYMLVGKGSHVWDVDVNEYIDWPMALGAIILGYGINRKKNYYDIYTLPHYLEVTLAEKLVEIIPCAEMVRFCKNGSDATEGAVRIARAVTGRKHIAMCMPGYHGSHDWSAVTGGLKRGLIDDGYIIPFNYNEPNSLYTAICDQNVAAVIMEQGLEEPAIFRDDGGDNFLQLACEMAHAHGALFILDEIVTGFRYSLGGCQELYNVTPDLCTIGKAMGNGSAISAICGKKEYMQVLAEGVFFSFTFAGEVSSIAAALETINTIEKQNVVKKLWDKGTYLREHIIDIARSWDIRINLKGNPVRSVLEILDDDGKPDRIAYSLFLQTTLSNGILFGIPIFPCLSHTDKDIKQTLSAVWKTFEFMHKVKGKYERYLAGEPIAAPVIRALGDK